MTFRSDTAILLTFVQFTLLGQQQPPQQPPPRPVVLSRLRPGRARARAAAGAAGDPTSGGSYARAAGRARATRNCGCEAAGRDAELEPSPTGGLTLQNASLREVIDILAQRLKINYILDPRVNGAVTINTYGETKNIDNRTLLDTILRINNAAMIQVGEIAELSRGGCTASSLVPRR